MLFCSVQVTSIINRIQCRFVCLCMFHSVEFISKAIFNYLIEQAPRGVLIKTDLKYLWCFLRKVTINLLDTVY